MFESLAFFWQRATVHNLGTSCELLGAENTVVLHLSAPSAIQQEAKKAHKVNAASFTRSGHMGKAQIHTLIFIVSLGKLTFQSRKLELRSSTKSPVTSSSHAHRKHSFPMD